MKRMLLWLLLALCLVCTAQAETGEMDSFNWYEIFVRSFQDSNGDGIGDLPGVLSRLGYLEQMGYDGIWLMPVMPSPSYHKYDVTDYRQIDPDYGTLEDFKQLVNACHQRGIRLIVDLPINHTSVQHPWFLQACDALRAGDTENPLIDFYCFSQSDGAKQVPVEGTPWFYEEQFSGGGMPDLNLDSAAVREEITAILDFWLNGCGVDGFRLDAVTSYYAADTQRNVAFLSWLAQTAKQLKPGCYLVGEAWLGLEGIAQYQASGVDSFFLFPASQAEGYIAKTIRARSKPARQYVKYLQQVEQAMGDALLAPFLSNHDTGRAVGSLQARSAPERAKFAHALVSLMGGATFTYYGEEIGMVGSGDDPNKRLAMYWNDGDMTQQPPGTTKVEYAFPCVDAQWQDGQSLLRYCQKLNILKKENPAIALGKTEFVCVEDDFCLLKRTWRQQECYVAINFSAKASCEYQLQAQGLRLAGQLDAFAQTAGVTFAPDGVWLVLPPCAIVILAQ